MTNPRRNSRIAIAGRCLVLTATCGAFLFPAAAQITAIRAGKLIDPDSGTVLIG